jgi:hypothetical protein
MRRVFIALMALAALSVLALAIGSVVAGSGGWRRSNGLADDSAGAEACGIVDRWLRGGREGSEFEVAARAGEFATRSSTEAIRSLAKRGVADRLRSDGTCCDGEEFFSVDLRRLHRACVDEGVDLPPY